MRQLSRILIVASLALPFAASAQTEVYPSKRLQLVVPFATGNGIDQLGREYAEALRVQIGQPVVVENREGAGGIIGGTLVSRATADGYTVMIAAHPPFAIATLLQKDPSFDIVSSFTPVAKIGAVPLVAVTAPSMPFKTWPEMAAYFKANPDKANYGSPAAGSTPHFLGALLGLSQNVELKHIPYRGSVPGLVDVMGGQIASMFCPAGDPLPNHRAGKLRLLATSGKTRLPFAPDVATFGEQGFGELTTEEWFGFYAPSKTPAAVLAAANTAINAALKDKALVDGLAVVGLLAQGSTPDEMARSQRAEFERWGPLIKRIGFTADS